MNNYTQGPWEVVTMVGKTGFIIDSPKTKNLPHGRIADVQQYGNGSAGPMRAEAAANARLIAAAPDLLMALREADECMSGLYDGSEVQARIRAAIAKATGG